MGSYELDNENYLHYTGDGWIQSKTPLTVEQIAQFKANSLDVYSIDWVDNLEGVK
jgi:hypothetical protein